MKESAMTDNERDDTTGGWVGWFIFFILEAVLWAEIERMKRNPLYAFLVIFSISAEIMLYATIYQAMAITSVFTPWLDIVWLAYVAMAIYLSVEEIAMMLPKEPPQQ